ncbi:phosphotransferase enzyme family protein [Ohtaekwangia sp.]|uniref:phosphotransferase enzyme family protein n=1 Tax=Ohtaekwangia sp. TaxID=2066019 RepID=UPI002FDF0A1F
MKKIPAASSILSAEHLNLFARALYALSSQSAARLLKAGINHSYLIEDGAARYIFRIYSLNWRTRDEISEELRFIDHLYRAGVQVSYPIADANGNYIQTVGAPEGDRLAVMFSYAPGNKLQNFSADVHEQIGELMGRIHLKAEDFVLDRITYSARVLLVESLESVKKFLPADSDEMTFLFATQQELLHAFRSVNTGNLRKGAVHLDIWFDNLNISPEQGITLFDFDFCGNGWLCLDIAYYLMQLFVLEPDEKEYILKKDSFLKGYERMVKIHDEERRILPMLGICLHYFYLGIQCRRFENWSNVFLNEVYLKRYVAVRIRKFVNAIS